ncbi:hypothetical protein Back2_12600 [Nocardioides baekrokdamisoli]|uniref:Uncharacterized protein n=1 Tax=Nocardioides baekrokdamisoli TaxID=1804624 RepID=A0A3G9IX68_9ACTN|nr:hypothetical protein [Nocardioides baekrokdamisoli]BBH16973.1 hypothetical protein Back2_12600 [Nocardioides baekrokdamisoli]
MPDYGRARDYRGTVVGWGIGVRSVRPQYTVLDLQFDQPEPVVVQEHRNVDSDSDSDWHEFGLVSCCAARCGAMHQQSAHSSSDA